MEKREAKSFIGSVDLSPPVLHKGLPKSSCSPLDI